MVREMQRDITLLFEQYPQFQHVQSDNEDDACALKSIFLYAFAHVHHSKSSYSHICITNLAPQLFSKIYVFKSTSLEYEENTKNTHTKSQKIASCVTHAKEAHKPDQTDQRSPGTDVPTSGPTRQCTRERR